MIAKHSSGLVALVAMLSLGMFTLPARAAADDACGSGQSSKKDPPAAKSAKPTKGNQPGNGADVVVIDRDGHRRGVQEFFTRETLPPGLAKREALPPGLREQLREKGRLPPGLEKHLTPVPVSLGNRLPAIPPYYSRHFAGGDLVIVDTRTNRFVSVIRDVLP